MIIVKGHQEIFFEFGADDKRDLFVQLLERQMEDVRLRLRLATGEVFDHFANVWLISRCCSILDALVHFFACVLCFENCYGFMFSHTANFF